MNEGMYGHGHGRPIPTGHEQPVQRQPPMMFSLQNGPGPMLGTPVYQYQYHQVPGILQPRPCPVPQPQPLRQIHPQYYQQAQSHPLPTYRPDLHVQYNQQLRMQDPRFVGAVPGPSISGVGNHVQNIPGGPRGEGKECQLQQNYPGAGATGSNVPKKGGGNQGENGKKSRTKPRSKPKGKNNSSLPTPTTPNPNDQAQKYAQSNGIIAHGQAGPEPVIYAEAEHQMGVARPVPHFPLRQQLHPAQFHPMVHQQYEGHHPKASQQYDFSPLFFPGPENRWSAARNQLRDIFDRLSLQQQFTEMQNCLSLTGGEQRDRQFVLQDLEFILRKEFPRCVLYPFGSYMTGLSDPTSDVDVYFDAYGVTFGNPLPPKGAETQDILERCYRIVRRSKCPRTFKAFSKSTIPIREARVPILKVTHYSNINLDLSFENLTSLRNSEMIALYMEIDPCVRPLIIIIRFFAKFHDVVGSSMIKSYCITLLILVFLTRKKIVPSVATLQKLRASQKQKTETKDSDIILGWNTGFIKDLDVIKRTCDLTPSISLGKNREEVILQLAKEFFDTYAKLEFSKYAVCSYTAEFIEKRLFIPGYEEDLPESLDRYKEWAVQQPQNRRLHIKTSMCVQDPFVLSFNVGATACFSTLSKFQIACKGPATMLGKGVKSLLSIFKPLPPEVGDRKFLTCQEKHRRTLKFKEDIKHFLEHKKFPETAPKDPWDPPPEEQLSLHLEMPLSEYLGKETHCYGKGWQSLLILWPSQDFKLMFADGMLRCGISQRRAHSDLVDKLKSIWLSFVNDFMTDIWGSYGLVPERKEIAKPCRRIPEPDPFHVKKKSLHSIFSERTKKNKSNDCESTASPGAMVRLMVKLDTLGKGEPMIVCGKITCNGSKKFWHERPKACSQVVERLAADLEGDLRKETGQGDRKRPPKPRVRQTKLKKSLYHHSLDPLKLEQEITKAVIDALPPSPKKEKNKPICTFTILYKIDNSLVDDWPCFSIVVDDVRQAPGPECLMYSFEEIFEVYCLHRLQQWFKEACGEEPKINLPSTSEQPSTPEDNGTENHYDLLMPPSSSSSSGRSSPVGPGPDGDPVTSDHNDKEPRA